jgi:hypothetical protein
MKKITILIATLILTHSAFAAPQRATSRKAKAKPITSESVVSTKSSAEAAAVKNEKSTISYGASIGLGTAGKAFHFGPSINGLVSLSKTDIGEIELGGQTGFLLHPGSATSWIIPIMVSGQLTFKKTGSITPYAGLAMGVGIFHVDTGLTSEQEAALEAAGADVSATDVDFAMLVRGGVYFGDDNKFFAELPLGTLGNAFAILPGFGMKF